MAVACFGYKTTTIRLYIAEVQKRKYYTCSILVVKEDYLTRYRPYVQKYIWAFHVENIQI